MCKHDFEIISKDILPSAYEQEHDKKLKDNIRWESNPLWSYKKKIVIILKCSICKKIKTIVEVNP